MPEEGKGSGGERAKRRDNEVNTEKGSWARAVSAGEGKENIDVEKRERRKGGVH